MKEDVARTIRMRILTSLWSEILGKKEACLDLTNDDGRIILKWTLKKLNLKVYTIVNVHGYDLSSILIL